MKIKRKLKGIITVDINTFGFDDFLVIELGKEKIFNVLRLEKQRIMRILDFLILALGA